jgi:hypothetical protein
MLMEGAAVAVPEPKTPVFAGPMIASIPLWGNGRAIAAPTSARKDINDIMLEE